jgi:hypothetical protein
MYHFEAVPILQEFIKSIDELASTSLGFYRPSAPNGQVIVEYEWKKTSEKYKEDEYTFRDFLKEHCRLVIG